jgi:hypothetical protein
MNSSFTLRRGVIMTSNKSRAPLASIRLLLPILFVLFLVSIADAYTIVLRDGRRVEIPSDFATTPTTLTYEVGAGIQVTLQVAAIDIAATELANNEPAGSLLRQRPKQPQFSETKTDNGRASKRAGAPRTITNRDLETFRLARVESEAADERRRKELGLPSIDETRRRAAVEAEESLQRLNELNSQQQDSETYWRTRASALRAEIAATSARINFLQRRLNELPQPFSTGAFINTLPFGTFGRTRVGRALRAPVGVIDGRTGGQVFVDPGPFRGTRRLGVHPLLPFTGAPVVSLPFQSYDYSLEGPALNTELDQLLAYRAGLEARWSDLEDEARRAGVSPGWLRP